MWSHCGAPAANQNAIPVMIPVGTRQRQGTLGKGKYITQPSGWNYLCKCDLAGYEMEICLTVLVLVDAGLRSSLNFKCPIQLSS